MATAEKSNTYNGVTSTYRITYSKTDYDDRAVVTITKIEFKQSPASQGTYSAGTGTFYYNDSSFNRVTTTVSYNAYPASSSYVTIWSGSKAITTYKTKAETNIMFSLGGVTIPIGTATPYTITYNANGGSTAPTSQTKYHGFDLQLANSISRTGYSFVNWLSSYDSENYQPLAYYTKNHATTMTAQWLVHTYRINYNNNNASGYIAPQIKTYDSSLNFDSGSAFFKTDVDDYITREYELTEWNINPDGSGTSYSLGSEIPNITSNLTVYAIWELKYLYPYINNVQVYRTAASSISDTTRADKGAYIYISFDFTACSDDAGDTYKIPECTITIDDDVYTPTLVLTTPTTGTLAFKPSTQYTIDNPHNVIIELKDPTHPTSVYKVYDYITSAIYPIDLYSNDDDNEVYMGVMHPYKNGTDLILPDTTVDGSVTISGHDRGVSYEGTNSSYDVVKFLDNRENQQGNGLAIGSGGLIVIGSGESADTVSAEYHCYDKVLALASDGAIDIYTNVQNGFASAKKVTIDSSGNISMDGQIFTGRTPITFTYHSNSYVTQANCYVEGYKIGDILYIMLLAKFTAQLPTNYTAYLGDIADIYDTSGDANKNLWRSNVPCSSGGPANVSVSERGSLYAAAIGAVSSGSFLRASMVFPTKS